MARRVFYSFHFQNDSWRASKVRNIGMVEGNAPASDNSWETVKRGGDASIQKWINAQLLGRTCTIVLVGAETADRRWVRYEIEKSWNDGNKGLFGIRIHKLLDHQLCESVAGDDPFARFTLKNGKRLSSLVKLYDPPGVSSAAAYQYISNHLVNWIDTAIASR